MNRCCPRKIALEAGPADSTKVWGPLLKVKRVIDRSYERWSLEIEPASAHVGMRSFAVFAGDAVNSCMLRVHVKPASEATANRVIKSLTTGLDRPIKSTPSLSYVRVLSKWANTAQALAIR